MSYVTVTTDYEIKQHKGVPDLATLQAAVGGYIEAVDLPTADGEITLWVNEEGKLVDQPEVNHVATLIALPRLGGDLVCGNVVFTGGVGPEGETLGLTEQQEKRLMHLIELACKLVLAEMLKSAQIEIVVVGTDD